MTAFKGLSRIRRTRHEYDAAVELRKRGLSYPEISRELRVSKSTLSLWLRHIPVTLERQRVTPSEVFRTQGQRLHAERLKKIALATAEAREEVQSLSLRELMITGAMLYWAEGTKDPKTETFEVANSDPVLVQFALRWLREVCGVPDHKIHVQMHIHTDLDEEECRAFWMAATQLPREQFLKTQIKHSSLGHRKRRSYYGTVQVRVWNRQLYRRVQGWICGLGEWITCARSSTGRAAPF